MDVSMPFLFAICVPQTFQFTYFSAMAAEPMRSLNFHGKFRSKKLSILPRDQWHCQHPGEFGEI